MPRRKMKYTNPNEHFYACVRKNDRLEKEIALMKGIICEDCIETLLDIKKIRRKKKGAIG